MGSRNLRVALAAITYLDEAYGEFVPGELHSYLRLSVPY